jgi:hypothetical protein
MTPDERSNEDLVTDLLCERIRELESQLGAERRQKNEVLGRLEKVTAAKHSLETRVALLEADLGRARQVSPVESREVKLAGFDVRPAINPLPAMPRGLSDHFLGIP